MPPTSQPHGTSSTPEMPSTLTHTSKPTVLPHLITMLQEQETGTPFPQSSRLSLQDYPPLLSQKKPRRLQLPSFLKKSKTSLRSIPQDPPSPPSPALSSPFENPESLSSSGLTVRPAMTTDPTPPPVQSTAPGSMRTTSLLIRRLHVHT
ncbi:hypothetical protein EV421DRAFT_1908909 [Armillaria borealis]|uniref:Uncharacterized protein n=1 Tax=Armillaria borealis TaxID=47425 RepID=A0AA39MIK1_9AGAR|nr:hypothetical protein EV421DRAFT_1908909 [Armillaria borealis]